MSIKTKGNQKHLTLSDRIVIETSLEKCMCFCDVAKLLSKDPSSISKEVRKHFIKKEANPFNKRFSCNHFKSCTHKYLCKNCHFDNFCKNNKSCKCKNHCQDYEESFCQKLVKPPYVCNGCDKRFNCREAKKYYKAQNAYDQYKLKLKTSREGINLSEDGLNELDGLITTLVKRGQPLSHICMKFGEKIPVSSRTIYNYINSGALNITNLDLPRKVKYKPRKKNSQKAMDKAYRQNRTYADFNNYLSIDPDVSVVEMDTVVGPSAGDCLLTMLFRSCSLMLAFLIPNQKGESVSRVFGKIKTSLGSELFSQIFPLFLTDNGSEFMGWTNYLSDESGDILSEIFFCDPNAAYQKGRIEKNHEYIRLVIPKGKSFSPYSQEDITLMINHINSTARASLNGRTPFELAQMLLPSKLLDTLNLEAIDPEKVQLKPALLKH